MIQIDKTMPQNCYDCPCTNDGFYRCLLADKQLEDDCEGSRPTWCPLHEVADSDTISRPHWIRMPMFDHGFTGDYCFQCSECKALTQEFGDRCPKCGADMRP